MRLSIRLLMVTGFLLVPVIFVAAVTYLVQNTISLAGGVQDAAETMQTNSRLSAEVSAVMLRQYFLSQHYHLHQRQEDKEEFIELSFAVYEKFHQLEESSTGVRELQEINELKTEHFRFENLAMRLFAARDLGREEEALGTLVELNSRVESIGESLRALNEVGISRSADIASDLQGSLVGYGLVSGGIIFGAAVISVLFLFAVRRTVLTPTRELIRATERVTEGRFDTAVELKVRNELGTLARSFNLMVARLRVNRSEISEKAAALERLNSEITALNATLEQKVEERTRALAESKSFLQRIIYGSPVSIAIFDREGVCSDCNEAFLRLVGAGDKDAVVGGARLSSSPSLSDEALGIAFRGALAGESRRTNPVRHEPPGGVRWFVHNFFPTFDLEGSLHGVILFSEDVTEQKLARDRVQAKNKELESFVYTVSHDLKSPLFSVSGMVQILESEMGDAPNPALRKLMGRIVANLGHMEQMINDLLELSRVGIAGADFEPLDLGSLVRTIVLEERARCGSEGVEVEVEELPELVADERQIEQLFGNLIGNAFKYRDQSRPLVVKIFWVDEGDSYHFTVADNGVGLDPAIRDQIFDVFFRVASADVEGTGVGLAIAKKVVENHGGRMWVASEPVKGAAFHFTLLKSPDRGGEPGAAEAE